MVVSRPGNLGCVCQHVTGPLVRLPSSPRRNESAARTICPCVLAAGVKMRLMTWNVCSVAFSIVEVPRIGAICPTKHVVGPGFAKNHQRYPGRDCAAPSVMMIENRAAPGYSDALADGYRLGVIVKFNCSLAAVTSAALSSMSADHRAV